MNRRRWGATVALVVGGMAILTVGQGGPSGASSLSRSSSGWSAARFYLAEMGSPVRTLDTPIAQGLDEVRVLVVAGSASSKFSREDVEAVQRFLRGGGRLVFGYGREASVRALRQKLGFGFRASASYSRSLNPFKWKEEAEETLRLPLALDGPAVAVSNLPEYPAPVDEDGVLVKNARNEPLITLRPMGAGEVLLLPEEVFSNGRLKEPGNAALLEGIRQRFGDGAEWAFDEYHHGVTRASSPEGLQSRRGLDLFILQILIAYALFVLALGRRFGPEWPEPQAASGATSSFLMTVAAIHDRLGHHTAAAQALQTRAREVLHMEVEGPAAGASGLDATRGLLEVARRIHARQREGKGV